MACLELQSGIFSPRLLWSQNERSGVLPNGTSFVYSRSGTLRSFIIEKGSSRIPFNVGSPDTLHYLNFGNPSNYILILVSRIHGDGTITRSIVVINTTGNSLTSTNIISYTSSQNVSYLPIIRMSRLIGSLFFLQYSSSGAVRLSIRNSESGISLVSTSSSQGTNFNGEVTATLIKIVSGNNSLASIPVLTNNASITPNQVSFPDAIIGNSVDPSLNTTSRTIIIKNIGNDCLPLNSIANTIPFSVASSIPPDLKIQPNEQFSLQLNFSPNTIGNFSAVLPINPKPKQGHFVLQCSGLSRGPIIGINHPSNVNMNVNYWEQFTQSITIQNIGEISIDLNIPESTGDKFVWTGISVSISPGASYSFDITFIPENFGTYMDTVIINSNIPNSPTMINLFGKGEIILPDILTPPPVGPLAP